MEAQRPKGHVSSLLVYLFAAPQVIPSGLPPNAILFDTVGWDNLGEWDPVAFAVNFRRAGHYVIVAQVTWLPWGVADWQTLLTLAWPPGGAGVTEERTAIVNERAVTRAMSVEFYTPGIPLGVDVLQTTGVNQTVDVGYGVTYLSVQRVA